MYAVVPLSSFGTKGYIQVCTFVVVQRRNTHVPSFGTKRYTHVYLVRCIPRHNTNAHPLLATGTKRYTHTLVWRPILPPCPPCPRPYRLLAHLA